MIKLNLCDIQGFVSRGYSGRSFPHARFLFATITNSKAAQKFVEQITPQITTGEHWGPEPPPSALNIAFTYMGFVRLDLPQPTLQSFPDEFVEGMRARATILGDVGRDGPGNWEGIWKTADTVHIWLSVYGRTPQAIEERCNRIHAIIDQTKGVTVIQTQEAGALVINGQLTTKEHFGYSDGFGNPDYEGLVRDSLPGQGKLTKHGNWVPLATGEFLLGYPDEAKELPVSPVPYLLATNGTFMVYRKLHENVAKFRGYLDKMAQHYKGGKEKLASKFVGRWRDGTPTELFPDHPNPEFMKDGKHVTDFKYGDDLDGTSCPIGSHIRRTNPRDAFGFYGQLVNRRRIMRRGIPYGPYVPEDQQADDSVDRGILFMGLGASLFRQFEFVQQQWVQYGNDAHLGNDKDLLLGNQGDHGKFIIPGKADSQNPPFICPNLPDFVELRGGDYFFLPSITALRMIGSGTVDPR
jgi:Dyp-type peroxidase family